MSPAFTEFIVEEMEGRLRQALGRLNPDQPEGSR